MDEIKLILNKKNVRKVATSVGFGLTMGKFYGDLAKAAINGALAGSLKRKAKEGNEFAQELCRRTGYSYEPEVKEEFED